MDLNQSPADMRDFNYILGESNIICGFFMHRGCTPKPCVFLGPTVQVLSEFQGFDVIIFIFVSVAGIHFIDHKLRYTK